LRVGISVGDLAHEDGDLFGLAVNEAARLCALAEGGEILLSDLARVMGGSRLVDGLADRGVHELKGLPDPIRVWTVEWGPAAAPAPMPLSDRLSVAYATPMVGRDDELRIFNRALADAGGGRRRLVLVEGEPGIGKTRLTTEAALDAHAHGAIVLYGRCDEELTVPYQPWIEALSHLVEHAPERLLRAYVAISGGELSRLVPMLVRRLGEVPAPTSSDAETERYLLFGAVVGVLEHAAASAPLVVVLDDLHWADRSSLLLLRHVMAAAPASVLAIGTYRASELSGNQPLEETLADLHRGAGVETIALRGLDDGSVAALLQALAGCDLGTDGVALAEAVARETSGNPFFAGEILREMAESGDLVQDAAGRWSMTERALPESVRSVVAQRVARLGDATQTALRASSVIGRDFDFDVLAAVLDADDDPLLELLERAVAASLIGEVPGPRERFSFTHALVRHTLYDDLSATRRRRLHRRVGEVLEAKYGNDPGDRVGQLATHWLAAGAADSTKAVHYARRAGERALAQVAPDDAAGWFGAALERLDELADADEIDRAQLLVDLGTAQREIGDSAYRQTLLDAANYAQEIDDTPTLIAAALANNRGYFSSSGQHDDDVLRVLRSALAASGTADSRSRASLLALLADELTWVPAWAERRKLRDDAVAMARRVGDTATLVDVLNRSCNPGFNFPHTLEERREANAEARRLAAQLTDPNLQFVAANRFLHVAVQSADPVGIAEAADTMRAIAHATGRPLLLWTVLSDGGTGLAALAGDTEGVERLAREYLEVGRAAGQPDAFLEYAGMLLHARVMQGRAEEVIEAIDALGPSETRDLPIVRAMWAAAYCDADRLDEARSLLTAEHDAGFDLPLDVTWSRATTAWAEVAARLGHAAACTILYERLLPFGQQIASNEGIVVDPIAYNLGLLATALANNDEAEIHYRISEALSERVGAVYSRAKTHLAWADMLLHRDQSGDAHRARALATQALTVARERGYNTITRRAIRLLDQLPNPVETP
jgi:hypothetical protein